MKTANSFSRVLVGVLLWKLFLIFFHMSDTQQKPKKNGPNMAFMTTVEQKKLFIDSTLDKFLEQYVFIEDDQTFGTDSVCHLLCQSGKVIHDSC